MSGLQRWFGRQTSNPFREMARMESSFDRLLNEMISERNGAKGSEFPFSPSCEVKEDAESYQMNFDLPGIDKEEVKVEVDGDRLTVRAERKEEKKEETDKQYLSEINYGSYVRSFTLPEPINEKKIEANFKNGVLRIRVPKTKSTAAKQIAVQ
ncbi:MAG: Hsp20/alpha crystallin family protein [Bdellovibrionales bacterium]